MNGAAGAADWQTVRSGPRSYYYHTQTKETSWTKPDALLTPAQLATGFTETTHTDGKPYWFKKANKTETTWNPPPGWNVEPPPVADEAP